MSQLNQAGRRSSLVRSLFFCLAFVFSHEVMSSPFAIPWTVAPQALLSMEFPRQEHWSGLPLPCSGYLPDPKIEPASLAWQADCLPLSHQGSPYNYFSHVIYSLPCTFIFRNVEFAYLYMQSNNIIYNRYTYTLYFTF